MHRSICAGDAPFAAHHDPRLAPPSRLLNSELKQLDDGEVGLWVELEVPDAVWEQLGDVRAGLQVTRGTPLDRSVPSGAGA